MSTQTTQTAERVKLVQVLVSFYAFREDDKASNELEHKEKFCVLVNGTQIFSKVVIKTETNSKATLYPVPYGRELGKALTSILPVYQRIVKVVLTSTQFVRKTPGATSDRKLKDSQISRVHTNSREIPIELYMSSNYENKQQKQTTTTDLLNNKLWWLWYPDKHLRCWIEKIKNPHEKNFEGEANNKLLDEEDTQRINLNNK